MRERTTGLDETSGHEGFPMDHPLEGSALEERGAYDFELEELEGRVTYRLPAFFFGMFFLVAGVLFLAVGFFALGSAPEWSGVLLLFVVSVLEFALGAVVLKKFFVAQRRTWELRRKCRELAGVSSPGEDEYPGALSQLLVRLREEGLTGEGMVRGVSLILLIGLPISLYNVLDGPLGEVVLYGTIVVLLGLSVLERIRN